MRSKMKKMVTNEMFDLATEFFFFVISWQLEEKFISEPCYHHHNHHYYYYFQMKGKCFLGGTMNTISWPQQAMRNK